MMKKLIIALFSLMLLLSSCGGSKEDSNTDTSLVISDEMNGMYYDKIAGRGVLEFIKTDDRNAQIIIDWASSAFENGHWQMDVTVDGDVLKYENGTYTVQTFDSSGNHSDEQRYSNVTGYFTVSEGTVVWHSDQEEGGNEDSVFVRDYLREEQVGIANPWTETTDLNEAMQVAGIEFDPPV